MGFMPAYLEYLAMPHYLLAYYASKILSISSYYAQNPSEIQGLVTSVKNTLETEGPDQALYEAFRIANNITSSVINSSTIVKGTLKYGNITYWALFNMFSTINKINIRCYCASSGINTIRKLKLI